jgi:hypothetical protein
MNQQRLDKLKQRADRATKLAEDIAVLREADPYRHGARLTFTDFSTGTHYLEPNSDFLKKAVAEGRLALLEKMEAELESLLTDPATETETANAD